MLSIDNAEARTRVMQLYKAWYRQIPQMVAEFDIPVSVERTRDILREKFRTNAHIKDTRVIDMLVIKVITIINTILSRKVHLLRNKNPTPLLTHSAHRYASLGSKL